MATITDTLQTLMQDLRDLVAFLRGFRGEMLTLRDDTAGRATTIINNFETRPLTVGYFVDPATGSDAANNGLTIDKPMRSIDAVLIRARERQTTQTIIIFLFGDDIIKHRHNFDTLNFQIFGCTYANNVFGRTDARRRVSFLAAAFNSPSNVYGTMSSGVDIGTGTMFTNAIDFLLPEVPAATQQRDHIRSSISASYTIQSPTISVVGAGAASLFASYVGGRLQVFINPTLGAGAAGHIFAGIAAGANPNQNWSYSTSLTSA